MSKKFARYLITSALPYANGPLHIGHLAGVYVPSDIYTRYLRLKGVDVISICGSDEHGVPITLRARNEGVTPQEIVDRYHAIIKKSFEDFGIEFDIYSRTTNPVHYETASEFFRTLYDKGEFLEMVTEQFFDPEANQFLADRYVRGTCPQCKNPGAYGDQCEKCGTSLNAVDLIDPESALTGHKPILKKTKHWFLPLDRYQPALEEWILAQHPEWKSNVSGQCKSWFNDGLQPRAVSRDLSWGVPVPLPDSEGKVLYVWFDAPIGYISATKELTPEWEKYWKQDDTRLIHFIGKDNIVFHCIIFPAMLKAHGEYILPDNVPANEFLNLEGDKLSTSRNWAVWLHEYLEDFPGQQDALRYTLTANMPESKDNDFTWDDFMSRTNGELVAVLGNYVNRVAVLIDKYYGGKVPNPGELNEESSKLIADIHEARLNIERSMEAFRFRDALKHYMQLARTGNAYLAEKEPWKHQKDNPGSVREVLFVALQITAALAYLGSPFLPFASKKLVAMLNLPTRKWDDVNGVLVKPDHKIGKPELLFRQILPEEVEAQREKLRLRAEQNESKEKKAMEIAPQKQEIEFAQFEALDLRVGTVLEAELVPKTDKLIKMLVDVGFEKRTIVSGIAKWFTPEEMIGKRVTVVLNLAPRKIRGVESKGMLLFANGEEGKLILVSPTDPDAPNGAVIS